MKESTPLTLPQHLVDAIDLLDRESERGCILVGAALVDQCLEDFFRALFVQDKLADDLLAGTGPLATFSAREKVAYSLGFLPQMMFNVIEIIRAMRNDAAHFSKKRGGFATGFTSKATLQRCRGLVSYEFRGELTPKAARAAFVASVSVLGGYLVSAARSVREERAKSDHATAIASLITHSQSLKAHARHT